MWYVMQVYTGMEAEVCRQCCSRIMKDDEDIFVLVAERMTKIRGNWSLIMSKLFPGYVFVETNHVLDFYERLKMIEDVRGMIKVLRTGDEITPVYPEEEAYLRQISGKRHIVKYSQGYINGDSLVVISGALKDCQGKVKKILRHKRLVVLEIPLMGRLMEVTVGMGIVARQGDSRLIQRIEEE